MIVRATAIALFAAAALFATGSAPPAAAEAKDVAEKRGCYLNFVAFNGGNASVFIDIGSSRIRSSSPLYGIGTWSKIENTPSQNVKAKERRSFTVWAKLCGLTGFSHQVDFVLKNGANARSLRVLHGGGDKTESLGDLSRLF